jgi:UDP-N-acetylmuramyl tripeptide synthase
MRLLGRNATTLPGKIAVKMRKKLPDFITQGQNVTLITGTNGKTTATRMLCSIYEAQGYKVVTNVSGANLISGIMTSLIEGLSFSEISSARKQKNSRNKPLRLILEIDEAAFGRYSCQLNPIVIGVTNLFRDQLDRYGELSKTRELIRKGMKHSPAAKVILCADDSLCASLATGLDNEVLFFGVDPVSMHDADEYKGNITEAGNCVFCGASYKYLHRSFGHLGDYSCPDCNFARPHTDLTATYTHYKNNFFNTKIRDDDKNDHIIPTDLIVGGTQEKKPMVNSIDLIIPIPGEHNIYNALCATALATANGISLAKCKDGLLSAKAGFGRMERFVVEGREICIVLVKNPVGLDRALSFLDFADDIGPVLFLLNDNIADGTDVSWIWDVDFESRDLPERCYVSGGRCYDMALRLKYAGVSKESITVSEDYIAMFKEALMNCKENECFYLLPNYTSLLELRAYLEKAYDLKAIWR